MSTPVETNIHSVNEWKVVVVGRLYQLVFRQGELTFCDDRGGEKLNLAHGDQQAEPNLKCVKRQDEQGGCDDDALNITVSSPKDREPTDRIAIGANNYWLKGRADSCANEGTRLIAGSGTQVVVIDGTANTMAVVDPKGADQVAIGSGWVAWKPWDDKSIHLISQANALSNAVKQ